MNGVVVAGTDTGVGKTIVAAALLRALARLAPAKRRRYWKPVQTGWPADDDTRDVAALAGLAPSELVAPLARLALPASPYEAALAEGARAPDRYAPPEGLDDPDLVTVVEGAGGLLVPLDLATLQVDVLGRLGLPFVLVARPEVGTLNHTLLSVEALRARRLPLAAVVISRPATRAVREAIEAFAEVPVLPFPALAAVDAEELERVVATWLLSDAARRFVGEFAHARASTPPTDLVARDAAVVWHPYTQHATARPPLPIVAAHGAWLATADGNRVLDGISSWWTTLFGHGHPAIARAIATQAATLDHVLFAGATHEPAVRLAERLLSLAPRGLSKVFYVDDGSTAVEAALKLALAWHRRRGAPARDRLVALADGYHGDTAAAMSVSEDGPFVADFGALRVPVTRVPAPVRGRPVAECVAALRATLDREGARVAAMIVEPLLQGAAGMLTYPPEYLRAVRRETRARGILLVADEVFTGFGRTGARFACEVAGVEPDLLIVGKALTGGTLTLAAVLATGELYDAFLGAGKELAFLHGHSYTANPIACAAALATLDLLTDAVIARGNAIGARIERGLAPLVGRAGVREIRGLGPVRAVELWDPDGRGYLADVGPRMAAAALEHGVLLRPLGPVVYTVPPTCLTDAEADLVARAIVAAVEAGLRA